MRIAFCKFAGLAAGGIEKYLQSLALILKEEGHDVDYYYTNSGPIRGTNWIHPPNDEACKNLVITSGINIIKVDVGYRENNVWYDTNFFELFDENKYDCLITAGNGEPEFPYTQLKNIKIIHSVHGDHSFDQPNILKSVLICGWQAERWIANGGNRDKVEIIPPIVRVPVEYPTDFREKYNVPTQAFVFGMHQRDDPTIYSPASLEAFSRLNLEDTYMVIMGGSHLHKNFVSNIQNTSLKERIIFADFCSDYVEIHNFLANIDAYAHSRLDGEVCSASLIEAMYHGKPIISCPGHNNGHADQIQGSGFFCSSMEEYINTMRLLKVDKDLYRERSTKTKESYDRMYSYELVRKELVRIVDEVCST